VESPFLYTNTGIFKVSIYECTSENTFIGAGDLDANRIELASLKGFMASSQAGKLIKLMNDHYREVQCDSNPCPYSIEDIGYAQLLLYEGKRIQAPVDGISSTGLAALLNHACAVGIAARLTPTI